MSRIVRSLRSCTLAVAVLMATQASALAQVEQEPSDYGYGIKPVAPRLEKDADTTFLADFSHGQLKVLHAAGESAASCAAPKFVADGGLKGQIEVPGGANLRPAVWTVELLLRVPAGLAREVRLLNWAAGKDAAASLLLAGGSMAGTLVGHKGRAEFRLAASVGGNGHTIQRDAPDQWVYLTWGADASTGRMCMIARSLDGHLLNRNVEFASPASFRSVDRRREGDGPVSVATTRRVVPEPGKSPTQPGKSPAAEVLDSAQVEKMFLGSPEVEIKTVRISNIFREDLLYVQPERALKAGSMKVFTADQLDRQHAVLRTVQRRAGYPGYRNFQTAGMPEHVLPLAPGTGRLEVKLKDMQVGLYTL